MTVIKAENLSKKYLLTHQKRERYTALRDVIAEKFKNLFSKRRARKETGEEFWALRDVNFEVKQGDRVGIIGRNGAGKSTLLKVLSRITEPTSGRVSLKGRVASLLEVGTGFHPELTGRENIFLNGAILGMTRVEIKRKFDEIVAFSEVEKFLDTPVKHFSSGMYVRLAFSVAAHLEPEILIVDEVLAVGDSAFQKKCLGKMKDVAGEGRTVLLVSHNLTVVSSICNRAILLDHGQLKGDGTADKIVGQYVSSFSAAAGDVHWEPGRRPADSGRMRLCAARIICEGETSSNVVIDKPVLVQYDFETLEDGLNVCSSIHLLDKYGTCVCAVGTKTKMLGRGKYRHTCVIPGNFLNDGTYSVSIYLILDVNRIEVTVPEGISFVVHERTGREEYMGTIIGCIRPELEWREESIASHSGI
jgi:lipopolysaccharide transport system ATP-binding protein